ncbi:unnamed protein product [Prunus armeniaca]
MRRLAVGGSCGGAGARRWTSYCLSSQVFTGLASCVGPRQLSGYPEEVGADVKSSRNEAANSLAKDASPLRKKPRIPSAEKTQVRAVSSSSTRVKHLVCVDSRNVGGMRTVRGALPESHVDKLENHDLLPGIAHALSRSADGKSAHDLAVESRAFKLGGDSASLTSLEVRMEAAKKTRESSPRANGSSATSVADPKVDKSSPAGDASMSDMLKKNLLSNPSSCVDELEKKNAELASQLSTEQARYEKKTSDLRVMISELKSSLTEKDSELNSLAADLVSRKDAFFCLELKNADISLSYDKLLARFHAYHKSAEKSKSKAIIDVYKLGYLHCADETTPLYAIDDIDIETLCPDSPLVEGGTEEQAAGEDEAEEEAIDEMMANVAEQADGAAKGVADQAEAEEAAAQRSPAGVPE